METKLQAIDFFCGAGGATEGMEKCDYIDVVAAVNHDPNAIRCHKENHPNIVHYNHDIRQINAKLLHRNHPNANIFWWSAECTHFSKAKGGGSRDADSRMLNNELFRFIKVFYPEYIFIENVTEFRTWGPLIERNGKWVADKTRKGEYYREWVTELRRLGYKFEARDLNCADYGARTSRTRYFAIAARGNRRIKWPMATHSKNPVGHLRKWRAVGPILDLEDHGHSIFTRVNKKGKKNLVPATIARIRYGLNKYYKGKDEPEYVLRYPYDGEDLSGIPVVEHIDLNDKGDFAQVILQTNGGNTENGHTRVRSTEEPVFTIAGTNTKSLASCFLQGNSFGGSEKRIYKLDQPLHTITCGHNQFFANAKLIHSPHGGANGKQIKDLSEPLPTITCVDNKSVVGCFLAAYYGGSHVVWSKDEPIPTITCGDRFLKTNTFLQGYYGGSHCHSQPEKDPVPTILTRDKQQMVTMIDQQYGKSNAVDTDKPMPCIVGNNKNGMVQAAIAETSPGYRLVMPAGILVDNRIMEIKTRMLKVPELLKAQGFPSDYKMPKQGYLANKFIGNSVPPTITHLLTDSQFSDSMRFTGVPTYQ